MKDFEIKVNEQDMALIRRALVLMRIRTSNAETESPDQWQRCTELLTKLERQT